MIPIFVYGSVLTGLGQTNQIPLPVPPAVAKKQIQARYDEWSKAYMKTDVDTLLSILSPDYVLVNYEKKSTTLAQYSTYLKLRKSSGYLDPVKTSTAIKSLKLNSNLADVNAIETMITEGEDPQTHRPAKCLHRHEYLDVWSLSGDKWLLTKTTTIKESTSYQKK